MSDPEPLHYCDHCGAAIHAWHAYNLVVSEAGELVVACVRCWSEWTETAEMGWR